MKARDEYKRTLDAKVGWWCAHVGRWTQESVERYELLVQAYQNARRRLYLQEPDELTSYSLFVRLEDTESVSDRIERCEKWESGEIAAMRAAL